jgi:putative membrane protein
MMWHNGMGWGGWVGMTLAMLSFWSLMVFGVTAIFHADRDDRKRQPPQGESLQILNERLARGEIDIDEYRAHREAMRPLA